jgi:hypothetical protein
LFGVVLSAVVKVSSGYNIAAAPGDAGQAVRIPV